ncbi:prepilin-type N-terminal cleavage/methylation domain-containing protein [Ancylobacter sonchi]|uniref:type II secretion system protein n=1 Tax=Ancylobacter sonchi TaxID=1937790 RepID=UPI001BD1FD02|nr:prepilin-type N-terminal cleavage/methylation domain-containing protein [Ancylobacter sonchi]MBS7532299.1 prepilin-type N-terminal cleavage/methylation domain-containing protein [Ancylobacter sonchi]
MKRGFSLVELSIVLVILGLLTGGILAGQSLIRAAELRAVTTEYQRWVTSTQTFRDKYLAVPGDFRDATRFWGRQTSSADCISNSGSAVNTTTGVCDGNGNGLVAQHTAPASSPNEFFQFWRQLASAGLIEGAYNGISGASGVLKSDENNAPRSRIGNGFWFSALRDNLDPTETSLFFNTDHGNTLQIGALSSNGSPVNGLFFPEEVWNIDLKLDDGKPGRGRVLAIRYSECTSAISNTNFDAEYLLLTKSKICAIEFSKAF